MYVWDTQTDDTLPFRNSLIAEYALLLAKPPLGLGLSTQDVERIARMSMASRFAPPPPTNRPRYDPLTDDSLTNKRLEQI